MFQVGLLLFYQAQKNPRGLKFHQFTFNIGINWFKKSPKTHNIKIKKIYTHRWM